MPRDVYQGGPAIRLQYTSFCVKYRVFAANLKRSMRHTHVAGERLFANYVGQTVPVIDAATGEIRAAQIFVAVLGASNYTYACTTATQTAADWVSSLICALEYVDGCPQLSVPDQPRALDPRLPDLGTTKCGMCGSRQRRSLGIVGRSWDIPRCRAENPEAFRGCWLPPTRSSPWTKSCYPLVERPPHTSCPLHWHLPRW